MENQESRNTDMQTIFNELSEKNKEIVIFIAKGIKVAQEVTERYNDHDKDGIRR